METGSFSSPQQLNDVIADPISYFNNFPIDNISELFKNPVNMQKRDDAILFSISSLYVFIIENFTGPPIYEELNKDVLERIKTTIPYDFEDSLNLNGEYLHSQAHARELIYIPFTLLPRYNAPKLWIARTGMILQRCLTGLSPTLKSLILPEIEGDNAPILDGAELCLAYHLFHMYQKFFDQLEVFRQSIKFDYHLTGKLGKKTKFQQESKSQFILEILDCETLRKKQEEGTHPEHQQIQQQQENGGDDSVKTTKELTSYSREVKLDEFANLLERPKMDEEFSIPKLTDEEMSFLLMESHAILERKLGDEIRDEKSLPILTTILELKPEYDFATVALFEKSRIEQREHGTQQRAALQLQSINDDFLKPQPPTLERIYKFFLLEHPPIWEVKREMGLQMMRIGAARTAADIFITNKMWDELGICCEIAHDPSIAIPILEHETPSPLVLTVLGEQKKDKSILEQAWELSNHHMSRAKRSLAKLYIAESNWKDAIENYEIALRLNPLYPEAQYTLGCAYMRIEDFNNAIKAFQEVVSQKGDDSECFSNLAICFLTIDKTTEAHKAITQAIRFSRENPKIWENFMIISLRAEQFNDAIFGMEEINRVQPKWCNVQLIYEIMTELIEHKGDLKRFINAMEKISQTADCGFDFWSIYADLAKAIGDFESELEFRNNVIKALESGDKITEQEVFNRLAVAVEKYIEAAKKIDGKLRTAKTRARVTLKKYEDDFSSLDSYKHLQSVFESL